MQELPLERNGCSVELSAASSSSGRRARPQRKRSRMVSLVAAGAVFVLGVSSCGDPVFGDRSWTGSASYRTWMVDDTGRPSSPGEPSLIQLTIYELSGPIDGNSHSFFQEKCFYQTGYRGQGGIISPVVCALAVFENGKSYVAKSTFPQGPVAPSIYGNLNSVSTMGVVFRVRKIGSQKGSLPIRVNITATSG